MMNTLPKRLKILMTLFFIAVMSVTYALPDEIQYVGNEIRFGLFDDGSFGPYPIEFDFDFFGNTYSDFWVTTNGLVMFSDTSLSYENVPIPTLDTINDFIAPFWDDIAISEEGDISFQTVGAYPNRKCIIQFRNMDVYATPTLVGTFQVILYEGSNNIQIQYRSIVDLSSALASGNSASIGLENIDGTIGVQVSYNTAGYVKSGKAILFQPSGGTYTFNDNAPYDGVYLNYSIPLATSAQLISPAYNSTVGTSVHFEWEAAANANSYVVVVSNNTDLSSPVHTSADLTALSYDYVLPAGQTYYWSVYPKNSQGYESWSERWVFQTSASPPLTAVPQTANVVLSTLDTLQLNYTGGDGGAKTATITALPAQGSLYQFSGGVLGAPITTVPTVVTDGNFKVVYSANGTAGNSVGNFNFHFSDGTGPSPDVTYMVNVSPVTAPTFLEVCYESDRVELLFDKKMSDPSGKESEFNVYADAFEPTITSMEWKDGDSSTYVVHFTPSYDTEYYTFFASYTKGSVTSMDGGILESFTYEQAIKRSQNMTFDPLVDQAGGAPDFYYHARTTYSSPLIPIHYTSSNPAVVSVVDSTASVNGLGETIITAIQPGNDSIQPVKYSRLQRVTGSAASVILSNLTQEFTGAGIAATVETVPTPLTVVVTYNGSATLPVAVGDYDVLAVVDDPFYTGSGTGTLHITDLTPPVPDLATLPDATGECSVTPITPTATDLNTGAVTGTTTTVFPITTQGTTPVVWSYDDGLGNISTQNQDVVVLDITPPVTPVLADVTGECSATVAVTPTTTDNCAGTITGTTTDPLTYSTQGIFIVNWTFDDGNGNIIIVPQNVVVDDVTPPVAPTLADVTGECSATAVAPTTTDNCTAGDITGTTTDPLTYNIEGNYVITWTFDDGNGNTVDVDQNVIVDDVTPPVTPVLADVTGECSATVAVAPTTTDNCAGTITGTTTDPLTYSTVGIHVITWNFDDGNGNSINVDQNVIVTDVVPPVTPVLADLTGECSVTAVAPTTTDACAGTITGTTTDPLTYSTQGAFIITWTFDDGNGNSINVDQNVIVADVTDPVIPMLADVTGECTTTAVAPTTTDACAGTISGSTTDPLTYNSVGLYVITWTFDDGNGNSIDVDQNVVVYDLTPPVAPVLTDLSGECSVTAVAPTATDACAGTITGTTTDPLTYNTVGSYVITWTFDDGNGNNIDVDQNVTVTDVTPPVTPVLADLTGECSVTAVAPTTTDNCAGTITGTTTDPLTYSTQGAFIITWTFDDGNGNTIDVDQNVIVADVTDPVTPTLADLTGECSVTAVAPTTTDNCAGTITGTTTDPLTYSTQGSYVITWTFDDGNGNSIDVDQNVVVDDVTPPVTPTLANLTGECSVTAVAPTTTDNCAGTITGTSSDPLTYSTQGSYVITWTFDDGNGNSIDIDQNVVVDDITAPTATSSANVETCDGTVADIGLTDVVDNCTIPVVTYVLTGATTGSGTGDASAVIFGIGVTTVTYTVDDGNGNSTQYQFTVTYQEVEDIVVTSSEGTLTVTNTGSYQWIDCADNSIVAGETASTFTPTLSGEYAVILTQGACFDTSDCYSVTASGIGNSEQTPGYEVYPNPAHEYVTIDMINEHTNVTLRVVDMTGKVLLIEEWDRLIQTNLDISRFKAGMYMIQINSDQISSVTRIMKE